MLYTGSTGPLNICYCYRTPDYLARKVGLAQLFRMSRSGNCDALRCSAMSAPRVPVTAVPQGADANRIAEVKSNPEKEGEMATKE